MNSRSSWLQHTRDYSKQSIKGRKFFIIHKNIHNNDLFKEESSSKTPTSIRTFRDAQSDSISKIPIPKQESLSPLKFGAEDRNLTQKLKEKDNEIRLLRQLYDETHRKLETVEQVKYIEGNLRILDSRSPDPYSRRLILPDIDKSMRYSPNKTPEMADITRVRNQSTTNNRPLLDNFQHSLYSLPKYTKNHPKLVPSNPITGIPFTQL